MYANYNGRLNVINCKFIRIVGKSPNGHIINSNGGNTGQLKFEECEFIDCGNPGNMPLITVLNKASTINFNKCNFTYTKKEYSCMIVGIKSNSATFEGCNFIECGDDCIFLGYTNNESPGAAEPEGTFIFTNNHIKGTQGRFIRCDNMGNPPTIENNTFKEITITDRYLISIVYNQDTITLINSTFSNIVSSGSDSQDCKMQVTGCIFSNNQAYQGYAIYIEGENCDTTFTINNHNQFNNNYNQRERRRRFMAHGQR